MTQFRLVCFSLSLLLHCGVGIPAPEAPVVVPSPKLKVVEHFEKIGGSIVENPFPVPTIVRSIYLDQVQISDKLLAEMLANCLEVEGFHFKAYDEVSGFDFDLPDLNYKQDGLQQLTKIDARAVDDYKFDLALVARMPGHHFMHFILDSVTVNFNAPSPINADLLVTFFESALPTDFTTSLGAQFPRVNTLNLVSIDVEGVGHGIRAADLEYLLSGAIPSLRHMFIRGFNWDADSDGGGRLRDIFVRLGCPGAGAQGNVFLDKDYDVWEC